MFCDQCGAQYGGAGVIVDENTYCPRCEAERKWKARAEAAERECDEWKDRAENLRKLVHDTADLAVDGMAAHDATFNKLKVIADGLVVERDELAAQVSKIKEAFDICESSRGRFSCVDLHDGRCPKARAASASEWAGEWVCKCGSEQLEAALAKPAPAALADLRKRIEVWALKRAIGYMRYMVEGKPPRDIPSEWVDDAIQHFNSRIAELERNEGGHKWTDTTSANS